MIRLVVLGASDFAREVAWLVADLNARTPSYELAGFVSIPSDPRVVAGLPVHRTPEERATLTGEISYVCGIGDPEIRRRTVAEAEERGWHAATLVHPSVVRATDAGVGAGSVVCAGAILAPNSRVGRHCVVNLHAGVGHDATLGDFAVLSPGARVSGRAEIGEGGFLGTNASVAPRVKVGAWAKVGANSCALADVAAGESVLGVPARRFLPPSAEAPFRA